MNPNLTPSIMQKFYSLIVWSSSTLHNLWMAPLGPKPDFNTWVRDMPRTIPTGTCMMKNKYFLFSSGLGFNSTLHNCDNCRNIKFALRHGENLVTKFIFKIWFNCWRNYNYMKFGNGWLDGWMGVNGFYGLITYCLCVPFISRPFLTF